MTEERLAVEIRRLKRFFRKGCGFWKAEVNKGNCSFPKCACYPFWQRKYRTQS